MQKLKAKLIDQNMYEEIQQEFERLCHMEVKKEKKEGNGAWRRIDKAKSLSLQEQALLKALYEEREKKAQEENIAAFRLIPNFALLLLAKQKPSDLSSPSSSWRRFFHPCFLRKDKALWEELIQNWTQLAIPQAKALPENKQADAVNHIERKKLLKNLKQWRKRIAEYRGIAPDMVCSSHIFAKIIQEAPKSLDELERLELLSPYKIKVYGKQLLAILAQNYEGELPEGLSTNSPNRNDFAKPMS